MIPTIELKTKFPYCREYASSPVAIDPSYDRGIETRTDEVSFEYACFLISEGELNRSEYIELILEDKRTHAEIKARIAKAVGIVEPDELTYQIYEIIYKAELNEAINKQNEIDNSSWEDYE